MSASVPRPLAQAGCEEVNPSKDVPWFLPCISLRLMSPALTNLLEEYSGIPQDQQEKHLQTVRDQAWEVFPMPCTGLWWWLVLGLSTQPHYSSLLEYLQNSPSSAKLLDLGSCLGQDLRKLAHDGAPVKCLYGSDLIPEWETVGHALFRDQESFKGRYITAGIFDDPPDSLLVRTEGTWDVINILMFLHAFGWKDQVRACKKILKLLSSKPGSMIIGGQTGSVKAGEEMLKAPFLKEGFEKLIFRQSKETLKRMWEKVAESEGVKLKIWAEYRPRYELGEVDEEKRVQNENFFHKQIKSVGRRMFPPIERLE